MILLETKTNALVESLQDEQMKANILQYLWWITEKGSVEALDEFLNFLEVEDVKNILMEIDPNLFFEVILLAEEMQRDSLKR
ncbi:MAG: hypothetical protein AUK08_01580 [Candidatus Pacebacteria bacterium CG2_30_36_39]|nr:MAG: hypothetical protein AUK08_01580 [Candidatus Pacebacteria bacterium CG2_30_36_39]